MAKKRKKNPACTSLTAFDRTVQKTNLWLKELMQDLGWQDRSLAYAGLKACFHALRDVITLEESAQFAAQLPTLLRGMYFESWVPRPKPLRFRHKEDFLGLVEHYLGANQLNVQAEEIPLLVAASFNLITKHVSAGEVFDIRGSLPAALKELVPVSVQWPKVSRWQKARKAA
jgi:uncharacterized protein (DUF2267 family)